MKSHFLIITVILALFSQERLWAQSRDSRRTKQHFDLVLFGKNLNHSKLNVWLRTNPWLSDQWVRSGTAYLRTISGYDLLAYRDLPVDRYLGQDIRENYLLIKIKPRQGNASLSAIYVLPHSKNFDAKKIFTLIKENPVELQQHSLADYIRPRPYHLQANQTLTEHVEAPVRNLKPGVQEVRWLDILFNH